MLYECYEITMYLPTIPLTAFTALDASPLILYLDHEPNVDIAFYKGTKKLGVPGEPTPLHVLKSPFIMGVSQQGAPGEPSPLHFLRSPVIMSNVSPCSQQGAPGEPSPPHFLRSPVIMRNVSPPRLSSSLSICVVCRQHLWQAKGKQNSVSFILYVYLALM